MTFFDFKFEPSMSVLANVRRFRYLHQDVVTAGTTLPGEVITTRLLQALPPSYDTFVQTWGLRSEGDRTATNLYNLIESRHGMLTAEHAGRWWRKYLANLPYSILL